MLDVATLKEMLGKKLLRPGSGRHAVDWAMKEKSYSQRRTCALAGIAPRVYRRQPTRPEDRELRQRLREMSGERRRFGYRRLHILPRREGRTLNLIGAHETIDPVDRLWGGGLYRSLYRPGRPDGRMAGWGTRRGSREFVHTKISVCVGRILRFSNRDDKSEERDLLKNYLKLILFFALKHAPGPMGRKSESRFYWSLRKVRVARSHGLFDQYLDTLDEKSICVDLGANVGEITEILLKKSGKVYAFEPDEWSFSQLEKRVAGHPNVVIFKKAIGANDGTLDLYRDPAFSENRGMRSQGTSAYHSEGWGEGEPEKFTVEVIDICRFLREVGAPVDVIKMDIEGAEVDVLERLLSSQEKNLVKAIFAETHEAQLPELRSRTKALRRRVRSVKSPKIFLNWQ